MAEMFGPYRIEELIGRGGMGEVHRAFDTIRGRYVALKRLPTVLAADEEFRARFRTESARAARLNHPHVIPLHDFGEIDGRLFIDMRLVRGRDLANVLSDEGSLSLPRVVAIVEQVASALDAAHATGVVHRDIKPSNVLISTDAGLAAEGQDFAYLADFGIARVVSESSASLTIAGAAVGSLEYMAPERFSDGHGDRRVDVYSLGCLLYEMLTARKPYPAEGVPALVNAHLNLAPPRARDVVPDLPMAIDAVVARAMAKNPDDRYADAGALAAAARAAVSGQGAEGADGPMTSPPSSALSWEQTVRVAQTHPSEDTSAHLSRGRWPRNGLIALSVLAVVLVVLGGGALVLGLGRRAEASQVRTEPVRVVGANPFMPPVGEDRVGVSPPQGAGGSFGGGTPGLYGGTGGQAACDAGAMVAFLQAHPDKASAWAGVQGIAPSEIPGYVAGLTPVVLRADTAVTNHGFKSGRATVVPSVLQAGTAVLVDSSGVPRVRCSCGNPLTPPTKLSSPRYQGSAWTGFTPTRVVTVEPSAKLVVEFALVDSTTNKVFYRLRGSRGGDDSATPSATRPNSTAPSSTTTASTPTTTASTPTTTASTPTTAPSTPTSGTSGPGSPETGPLMPSAPETGGGQGAVPETGGGQGAVPETGGGQGAVPETGDGQGAVPETGDGQGAVPETGGG